MNFYAQETRWRFPVENMKIRKATEFSTGLPNTLPFKYITVQKFSCIRTVSLWWNESSTHFPNQNLRHFKLPFIPSVPNTHCWNDALSSYRLISMFHTNFHRAKWCNLMACWGTTQFTYFFCNGETAISQSPFLGLSLPSPQLLHQSLL